MRTASPRVIVVACAAFAAGAGAVALFGFGPLDPPNGPISPSYKTLSEVEPRIAINATNTPGDADSKFKITKTGSYYLTGNLIGVSGKSGIEVAANCTINLCGFELTGVNGSLDGIRLVGEFRGTVRDGQVVNWDGSGIAAAQCNYSLFEDLVLAGNGGAGISAGHDSVLSRVRAGENQTYGILVDGYCTIVDCVGSDNAIDGIYAGAFSTVSRCNTHGNIEHGIASLGGGNVSDCVAQGNNSAGIRTGGGIVRDNVADGNTSFNILVAGAGGALVRNNTCSNSAGSGIHLSSGSNYVDSNLLKSNNTGAEIGENGDNLVVRNYAVKSGQFGYFFYVGNNFAAVLNNPGVYFASDNGWANLEGY